MIRIQTWGRDLKEDILRRSHAAEDVSAAVAEIIEAVRAGGDEALRGLMEKFNGRRPGALELPAEELDLALEQTEPELRSVLETAAANIREFHALQKREGFRLERPDGAVLEQKILPLARVGITVPGGETPLASTVLMNAIPAKLAGCGEIIMVTPPGKDGRVNRTVLAAAKLAGVDRVFAVGGAQAIAALAYGTESIPRVDKIVGPGGVFVAEAKKQVFGRVAIDIVAGPSEILIVADGKQSPRALAGDMLAQAEHDRMASAVLLTPSEELALAVRAELERQLPELPREEIARASIENNGKIVLVPDIETALALANEFAPEHLELCLEDALDRKDEVWLAGSVFLGPHSPEALGDYLAGANHTLPTSGTARFSSALSVDDFIRKTQYIYYPAAALDTVTDAIARFAAEEGLAGHGRSVLLRREEGKQ